MMIIFVDILNVARNNSQTFSCSHLCIDCTLRGGHATQYKLWYDAFSAVKYPEQITDFLLYYSGYPKRSKSFKICLKCIDWRTFVLLPDLQDKSKDTSPLAAPCSHIQGRAKDWAWTEPETLWRITVTRNGFLFISFSWFWYHTGDIWRVGCVLLNYPSKD